MNIEILFNEEAHEYLINNVKAHTSVTSLVERQALKTTMIGVDPIVLQNAAERGNRVHKDLELLIRDGTEPVTKEGQIFKKYIQDNAWTIEEPLTEFKVAMEWTSRENPNKSFILAGTADLIATINQKKLIIDHKTTSVINKQYISWQLSLLDYMATKLNGSTINGKTFTYEPRDGFQVFHFDRNAQFKHLEINRASDIEIERLLDAEAEGREYFPLPSDIITPRQQEELLSLEQQIAQLEITKKVLEVHRNKLKKSLQDGFELNPHISSIRTDSFLISYIPGSASSVFDEATFTKENPELAMKYRKERVSKTQIRITLAKHLKEQIPTISSGGTISLNSPPPRKPKKRKIKQQYFDI